MIMASKTRRLSPEPRQTRAHFNAVLTLKHGKNDYYFLKKSEFLGVLSSNSLFFKTTKSFLKTLKA